MDPKGSEAYFDAVLAESVGLDYCMASHCLFRAFFKHFFQPTNYFQKMKAILNLKMHIWFLISFGCCSHKFPHCVSQVTPPLALSNVAASYENLDSPYNNFCRFYLYVMCTNVATTSYGSLKKIYEIKEKKAARLSSGWLRLQPWCEKKDDIRRHFLRKLHFGCTRLSSQAFLLVL